MYKSNLSGRICLVTGASKGVGKGISLVLGECGATVYVTGRNEQGLREVEREITQRGGKCIPVVCDHSQDDQVRDLFSRIESEQNGRLDVLINNAYSAVDFVLDRSLNKREGFWDLAEHESPEGVFDLHHRVGLRNSYICATLACQMMLKCRKETREELPLGMIVNISAIGSVMYFSNPAYGAQKAGGDKMTMDMGFELNREGKPVIAFSLWPGPVKSEKVVEAIKVDKSRFIGIFNEFGESLELPGRVLTHILGRPRDEMKDLNSTVVSTGDYAYTNSIYDIDEASVTPMRSVKLPLYVNGYGALCKYVPNFVQVPKFLMKLNYSIY